MAMKTDELSAHPAADLFPMMDDNRFTELCESVAANGLELPILICDGMILDGRNRYKACVETGTKPVFREFTDGDPFLKAWELNGVRRDLSADQRAAIRLDADAKSEAWQAEQDAKRRAANEARAKAANERRQDDGKLGTSVLSHDKRLVEPKPTKQHTHQTLAKRAGVGEATAARVQALRNKSPEMFNRVRSGEISATKAHQEIRRAEVRERLAAVETNDPGAATGVYDVIVCDPPWPMKKIDRDVAPNQVEFDYPTMGESELAALDIPAAESCHLFLWTTHKFLPMAMRLLAAWKFRYVCTFVWHKPGGFQPFGLPQYNCEFALYARIGAPEFADVKAFNTCFTAPRGAHSEKPEEFYELLRRVTSGRRLDMFNRRKIAGFDGWGKEAANG